MEAPRLGVEWELQLLAYTTATATLDPSYICNLGHCLQQCWILSSFFFGPFFFLSSRATPSAYGGSQTRGPIGAAAAGLYKSHSKAGSEPCLRPTPQLQCWIL